MRTSKNVLPRYRDNRHRRMLLAASPDRLGSQQSPNAAVRIDNDDIGGVVTSAKGAEAGVWVIAETTDLPTRFAKMVVTDDQGRYVVPDLPKATYNVWVRGYGLVDSPKVKATPGKNLNLKAVVAPSETAAAQYYPAIYWYSMMKIPEASEFGGKGAIPANITQNEWLELDEEQRLHRLPSVGPARHAHIPEATCRTPWVSSPIPRKRGFAASSPGKAANQCSPRSSKNSAPRPSATSRTGRTGSPRANCPMRSRRGRKESSATSSSPPGNGLTTSITFTT